MSPSRPRVPGDGGLEINRELEMEYERLEAEAEAATQPAPEAAIAAMAGDGAPQVGDVGRCCVALPVVTSSGAVDWGRCCRGVDERQCFCQPDTCVS